MNAVTLKEKAYILLKDKIIKGELLPGSVLTERMLVEMLGMSRTPIRAALERLDAEGLARYTPNKGLIVSEISLRQIIDIYDFRIALEGYLVEKLAGLDWPESDRAWFLDNLEEQREAVRVRDNEQFTRADAAFHRHLAIQYGNSEILSTLDRLQDTIHRIALGVLRKDHQRIQISYEDHIAIFQCMTNQDAKGARSRMERHLEYGKRILII